MSLTTGLDVREGTKVDDSQVGSDALDTLLLSQPVDAVATAVLDFETTGLSPASGDRVCELAVYRWRLDGKGKRKTLRSLIDPGVPMPPEAEAIHHIGDQELRGAPHFEQRLEELARMLDGAVLVAHNARFDVGFLRAECHRAGVEPPRLPAVVCTLDLARQYFGFSKCSLEALAWRTQTPQPSAHRALDDARVTFQVYAKLIASVCQGLGRTPTVAELLHLIGTLAADGEGRAAITAQLSAAATSGATLTVDYTARHGLGPLTCRRTLTATAWNPPHLEAWCHLRREPRVFNARRVQRII